MGKSNNSRKGKRRKGKYEVIEKKQNKKQTRIETKKSVKREVGKAF